jgi:pimeloyl-ACP methyl ester carboxylesterase
MERDDRVTTEPGNSPVTSVPDDYAPADAGAWFELSEGRDRGKKLFFWDATLTGEGLVPTAETDATVADLPVVLFVHGNPECSYAYRKVVRTLRDRALAGDLHLPVRLVAVDHVGFGLSSRATYETVPMDHAENLAAFVRGLDLQDVTLVVHDWGGPIGIGALLCDPGRVTGLVACNTTVFPMPFVGPTFDDYPIDRLPWADFPRVTPDELWPAVASYAVFRRPAGEYRVLFDLLVHLLRVEAFGWFPAHEERARRVYYEQFEDPWNTRASKRLVRQTRYWGHGNTFEDRRLGTRNTAPFYRTIHERLRPAWGPGGREVDVELVFGGWDPLAKDAILDQWAEALPQAEGHMDVLEGVSHFVEEERPERVATAVVAASGLGAVHRT